MEKSGKKNISGEETEYTWKSRIRKRTNRILKRFPVYYNRYYQCQIDFLCGWKKLACFILLLAFGIPVFLLPEKIEYDTKDKKKVYTATDTLLIDTYNKFASNETYKEKIKPTSIRRWAGPYACSYKKFMKEVTSPATKKRSCLSAHRSRTGRPCHK